MIHPSTYAPYVPYRHETPIDRADPDLYTMSAMADFDNAPEWEPEWPSKAAIQEFNAMLEDAIKKNRLIHLKVCCSSIRKPMITTEQRWIHVPQVLRCSNCSI